MTVSFQSHWFLIVSFDLCCTGTGADPCLINSDPRSLLVFVARSIFFVLVLVIYSFLRF